MEDWQNSSLEEKVDLDNLVLFSPDSYPIAEISELRSGIKEEQSEEDNDVIENSAHNGIKTENVEFVGQDSDTRFFESSRNGAEVCQTCGLEFGNKAVLKIHNSLVHPEENKDDQNSDLGGDDPFASLHTFDNSNHVSDSVQENCNRNKNNAKHDVETIEKIPTILEETEIQMQEPDAHCEESAKLNMDTSVHEKKKPFKCDICDYNFSGKGNLKRHTDSVHEGKKPYKCSICDKRCSLKAELKEHIEIVHEKKKPHKCPICDYKCAKKGNLNTHVASVHEKKKPHKCSICDFSCSQQSQLKRHIYSVHEKQKPHQCLMCDKSFSQLSQLKTHTDSVHENLKPYECSICDYSCSRKNDLKRHIKRNHIFSDDLYGLY